MIALLLLSLSLTVAAQPVSFAYTGLLGQVFNAVLRQRAVYNMVSDADVQYNAQIAPVNDSCNDTPDCSGCIRDVSIKLRPLTSADNDDDEVNEERFHYSSYTRQFTWNGQRVLDVYLQRPDYGVQFAGDGPLFIQSQHFEFVFALADHSVEQKVSVRAANTSVANAHGLIGQTWHPEVAEGTMIRDYEVSNGWADDFRFNKYGI